MGDHVWALGLLHLKNMFSNHKQRWQPHISHVHFFILFLEPALVSMNSNMEELEDFK